MFGRQSESSADGQKSQLPRVEGDERPYQGLHRSNQPRPETAPYEDLDMQTVMKRVPLANNK